MQSVILCSGTIWPTAIVIQLVKGNPETGLYELGTRKMLFGQ